MVTRREFLKTSIQSLAAMTLFNKISGLEAGPSSIPTRPLGSTGHDVTLFGLGGEGVLRTYGRKSEAVKVIERALELGVNYCDTAPAYSESQDYYGAVLPNFRKQVFLASKTHDRTKEGSLKLLKESLRRLRTDHLDLWQLHDLRDRDDLSQIFGKGGAIEAVEQAKKDGLIRFAGITGHHDPAILLQAAGEYPFDTALIALNAADRHYLSFIEELLPVLREKKMGIIGMKVYGRGTILESGGLRSAHQAMSYVLSLPVSNVIIGCWTPREVEENVEIAKKFVPLGDAEMKQLEEAVRPIAANVMYYKR